MNLDDPNDDDLTLTSDSLDESGGHRVDPNRADLIAERVLSEPEPLPFRTRFPMGGSIGKGGMAEVFLARDRVLNRVVAVKVMHDREPDEVRLRRFLREAQITAQLSHPNVVPVHAMENNGLGRPAFVMKAIQGETFKDFIARCREAAGSSSLKEEEHGVPARLDHLLKVCDAIAFAHSRGVTHRDLKPANVMIGAFGQVYVMDWGIALLAGDAAVGPGGSAEISDSSGLVSGTGGFAGTPMYLPPEQAGKDVAGVGPAADQYTLGMMLYEMLTLHLPRDGEDVDALVAQAKVGARLPFGASSDEPDVDPALRAVVDRATAREPGDRYASVEALAADLRRYRRNEELEVYPDNLVRRVWRAVQRHPARAMAGILLFVVLAAATAIVSLVHALDVSERMQRRTAIQASVVAKVSEFVHEKDQGAKRAELLTESLAVEVEAALRGPEGPGPRFLDPAALAALSPPSARRVARYKQVISFTAPLLVRAADADPALVNAQAARLGGMSRVFRATFLAIARQRDPALDPRARVEDVEDLGVAAFAYAGFASGFVLNYPAGSAFPADYDPRQRPWYRDAPPDGSVGWGDPYLSASGIGTLVPCVRRIFDPDGKALGVVGLDASLDEVFKVLRIPDLPGRQRTLLVEVHPRRVAELVAVADARGLSWSNGAFDAERRRPALALPGLEERLVDGAHNGAVEVGGSLYVFSKLSSLGWYVVVELDAKTVFGR